MQTINTLTDEKLREELNQRGFNIGPITPSTRKVYEHKLGKIFESEGVKFSLDVNGHDNGHENLLNGNDRRSLSPDNQIISGSPKKGKNQFSREKSPPALNTDTEVVRESDEENSEEIENSRILTPEEIRNFKSRINRSGLIDSKKSKKNVNRQASVMAFTVLILLVGIVLAAYMYIPNDQLISKFNELRDSMISIYKSESVTSDDKRVQ